MSGQAGASGGGSWRRGGGGASSSNNSSSSSGGRGGGSSASRESQSSQRSSGYNNQSHSSAQHSSGGGGGAWRPHRGGGSSNSGGSSAGSYGGGGGGGSHSGGGRGGRSNHRSGNRDATGSEHEDVILEQPLHLMRQKIDAAAAAASATSAAASSAPVDPTNCAWVTLVMLGDSYVPGALVLAHSLRMQGTRSKLVVLVSSDVSGAARSALGVLFDVVVEVSLISGKAVHQEWKRYTAGTTGSQRKMYGWIDHSFTKFHVLALTQFERVCLLDADQLCVGSDPDSLWASNAPAGVCSTIADARSNEQFAGRLLTPAQVDQSLSSYGMKGCIYLLRPNLAHFDLVKSVLAQYGGYGLNRYYIGADEKLMTDLYADCWTHLHWRWGSNSWKSDTKTLGQEAMMLHYVTEKPWLAGEVWPDIVRWNAVCVDLLARFPQLEQPYFAEHLKAVAIDRQKNPKNYVNQAAPNKPAATSGNMRAGSRPSASNAASSSASSSAASSSSSSSSSASSVSAAPPTAATTAFTGASAADRSESLLLHNCVAYASASLADLAAPFSWLSIHRPSGRVLELGRGLPASIGGYAESRDLRGQTVLPGLQDAHIHVLMTGRDYFQTNVRGVRSIQELQAKLKEGVDKIERERGAAESASSASSASATAAAPDADSSASGESWVFGSGWEQDELGRYPTKGDLDAVCSSRPVLLWRICSHICVLNSRALEMAGITASTPDPAGGAIDFAQGHVKESACEVFLSRFFQISSLSEIRRYLRKGLELCVERGITAVQTNDEGTWAVYKSLAEDNELPLRVFLTIQQSEIGMEWRPRAKEAVGKMLQCHRVKLFADGALGAQTASLSMPYVVPHRCAKMHGHGVHSSAESSSPPAADAAPSPANYGLLIHKQSELNSKVAVAHAAGFRIELHAIGDRAAEEGLNAFDAAGLTAVDRPILTHCQVLRRDLIDRMARMGVIADVQPQFAVTDSKWASERLPEELLRFSYAWKTLLDSGVHVAGGSDSPIEVPSALWGMHAAVFRPLTQYETDPAAIEAASASLTPLPALTAAHQWRPEECLSISEALHLYTSAAAFACSREHDLGFIRPGFPADLTLLDRDVIRSAAELIRARVTGVFVDGVQRK